MKLTKSFHDVSNTLNGNIFLSTKTVRMDRLDGTDPEKFMLKLKEIEYTTKRFYEKNRKHEKS